MTLEASRPSVPPTALVLVAIVSVQLGSSLAKGLFIELGPGGAAFLRVGFAALALVMIWRPQIRTHARGDLAVAALFGITLAAMNLSFYAALDRIPLGIGVTVEFMGPLAVAVIGSRRMVDLAWVGLAAVGIVLLAPVGSGAVNAVGLGLALLAGIFWAAYIFLSARVGAVFAGGQGLAIAMTISTIALLPVGIVSAGVRLGHPRLLAGGAVVAILSSLIPYTLEMEALRRIPTRVFGVLMSLEPAVAAVMGFLVLRQVLQPRELVALGLVTMASLGAARTGDTVVKD